MLSKSQTPKTEKASTTQRFTKPATKTQVRPQSHSADIIQRAERDPSTLTQADIIQLQRTIGNQAVAQLFAEPTQPPLVPKTENKTGLPDKLKAGIENLSGLSMDDVRVHYNSTKPAQLQALAYTQGADIHVGPRQERHLPHEGWHVQQRRVESTKQLKGKSAINDDSTREREVDIRGVMALQLKPEKKQKETLSFKSSSPKLPVQRMPANQARELAEDGQLVWYNDAGAYSEVRILQIDDTDTKATILDMNGIEATVPLADLHLTNPNDESEKALAIKGMTIPGPSKPIKGQDVINRGIVETEMVDGNLYVRVYSALMGSVAFHSQDTTTGEATSDYKDIHQNKKGKITISSGKNNVLWAGMGRPLRALKWSEKYFAQIRHENPALEDDYNFSVSARADVERKKEQFESQKRQWQTLQNIFKQPRTQKQKIANQEALSNKENQINTLETAIKEDESKISQVETKLGENANPVIRSFLIPFASFENISKAAIPEELNAVVSQSEEAQGKIEEALKAIPKIELLLTQLEVESLNERRLNEDLEKLKLEIHRKNSKDRLTAKIKVAKEKRKNRNVRKPLAQEQIIHEFSNLQEQITLQSDQLKKAKVKQGKLKTQIIKEFQSFEQNINQAEKDKRNIDHSDALENVLDIQKTAKKSLEGLAKKAMPDLDVTHLTASAIVNEMKNRELHTGSINVDRHYEPNQFGIKEKGLDILRKTAVQGSLVTYAMFPDHLPSSRKAESGQVRHTNELKDKLGVPKEALKNYSPWLQGPDFAKQKAFAGTAAELSLLYSTWVKSKNPHFDESSLLDNNKAKIPFKNRKEQLEAFLLKNGVTYEKRDEYMEQVVEPWASQSMIAHVMAEDYTKMNKDQNIVAGTTGQDFYNIRNDLPLRRKTMKETGEKLDDMIENNKSPLELLNQLIEDFPELEQRFKKISAKSEKFTFFDHAQMVYQQFMKLSQEDKDADRLMSKALIGKMILFHDMEKWNSKEQFGDAGEHKLTIDEIKKYKGLWNSDDEASIAQALVNSDPFGEYLKGKGSIDKNEAYSQIVTMAKRQGYRKSQYPKFFREYHQFYQADFSSYTAQVDYTTMEGKTVNRTIRDTSIFETAPGGEFRKEDTGIAKGRFKYKQEKEDKFKELEALF